MTVIYPQIVCNSKKMGFARKKQKIMDPRRFELLHLTIFDLESNALNHSAKDPVYKIIGFLGYFDMHSCFSKKDRI